MIDRSGSVRLCRLVLAALFLTACTSGIPPALRGSQLTPAATDVPVPASPVPCGSPSGAITSPPLLQREETVTLTFAADEYTLPAYQALAGTFHATHPAIRVVVVDLSHVHGNWRGFAPSPATLNELASSVDTFLLPESMPLGYMEQNPRSHVPTTCVRGTIPRANGMDTRDIGSIAVTSPIPRCVSTASHVVGGSAIGGSGKHLESSPLNLPGSLLDRWAGGASRW